MNLQIFTCQQDLKKHLHLNKNWIKIIGVYFWYVVKQQAAYKDFFYIYKWYNLIWRIVYPEWLRFLISRISWWLTVIKQVCTEKYRACAWNDEIVKNKTYGYLHLTRCPIACKGLGQRQKIHTSHTQSHIKSWKIK